MRTTIRLDLELLRDAKRFALETDRTLTQLIEDALRRALAPTAESAEEPIRLPVVDGDGLQPGVDLDDSSALLELMES